jgi:hypothetical protein
VADDGPAQMTRAAQFFSSPSDRSTQRSNSCERRLRLHG